MNNGKQVDKDSVEIDQSLFFSKEKEDLIVAKLIEKFKSVSSDEILRDIKELLEKEK
jgi:hypothetical protein